MELPTQDKDRGPIMPVPKGIRPVLSKHRIEVLLVVMNRCGRYMTGPIMPIFRGIRPVLGKHRIEVLLVVIN